MTLKGSKINLLAPRISLLFFFFFNFFWRENGSDFCFFHAFLSKKRITLSNTNIRLVGMDMGGRVAQVKQGRILNGFVLQFMTQYFPVECNHFFLVIEVTQPGSPLFLMATCYNAQEFAQIEPRFRWDILLTQIVI